MIVRLSELMINEIWLIRIKIINLFRWSISCWRVNLLAIDPSAPFDLTRRIVHLSVAMLYSRQPLPNIFSTIRVLISTLSLFLSVYIGPLIPPAVLPYCQSIPMQLIQFPSSIVLHSLAFVVSLTVEFAIPPEPFIGTAIVVNYTTEALLNVVFEVALVFVFLGQWDLCPIPLKFVLIKLPLISQALICCYVLSVSVESVMKEISLVLPTVRLPELTFARCHVIFPLTVAVSSIWPYLFAFALSLPIFSLTIILGPPLKHNFNLAILKPHLRGYGLAQRFLFIQ